jgi:hypothetical protein
MKRLTLILGTLILLAAPCGASDPPGYYELRAAQESLERDGDYLRIVPSDAAGRRDRAIDSVNEALEELHYLISRQAQPGTREYDMQQREEKLEHKRQQRDEQLDEKALDRQERIENR